MANEELKKKLCQQCNKQFSEEPCEPSECYMLSGIENAVEIPDCKKCFWNEHFAWNQCSHCLGEAENNFLAKEEVQYGR